MHNINIATEDPLSEAVAERLIGEYTDFNIQLKLRKDGNGYLSSNLKSFFEIAKHQEAFLLLTDLDRKPCVPSLIDNWKSRINIKAPDNFLFRVVVQEIESWLLADIDGFSKFIGVTKLPKNPDLIDNPKEKLLEIASKSSKKDIRSDLVKKENAIASQGIGYNAMLGDFIKNNWCPKRAAINSDSLNRACERLQELNRKKHIIINC